jgi:hypothetical protein
VITHKSLACYIGIICISVNSLILAAGTGVVSPAPVPQQYDTIIAQIQTKVNTFVEQRVSKQRALIHNEAVTAVAKVREALLLLDTGNSAGAQKQLVSALGKLNKMIEQDPTLKSVPVSVSTVVNDNLTSYDLIRRKKQNIDSQWQLGNTQKVRHMLNRFVSDTSIKSSTMPVKRFTEGIVEINQLISQDQVSKAKDTADVLLKSVVQASYSIPLPLFRAELMMAEAEKLTSQAMINQQTDSKQLHVLLSNAKYQLELAEALGYGGAKRYAMFYQAIEGIGSLVSANQQTTKLFSKLKTAMLNLKNEVIEDK